MKKREYAIDALRILSMLGILGLHVISAGGALQSSITVTNSLLRFIHIACMCSVNLFAMITGYLYIGRMKVKSANLLQLLVVIFAYSLVFTVLLYFFSTNFLVDFSSIFSSLFPMATGAYWYMVCYVFLFLMIPWLNRLLQGIIQKQYKILFAR